MKRSSTPKFNFVYFEEQKVTLGIYDVNKNISDGVVVLINLVRTPREELLDPNIRFCVFWGTKNDFRDMMSIKVSEILFIDTYTIYP